MNDRPREETSRTRELRRQQQVRETEERRMLDESELPGEAKQHERRSEKAAYLKQKLAERERAERQAAGEE